MRKGNVLITPKPDKSKFCYKVFFKHDGCSILLFDKLLAHQAIQRANALRQMYHDWHGRFIVTK